MPEVELVKPWRFYEDGCRPVDYKAGVVQLSDEALKVAEQCDVIEKSGKPVKPEGKAEAQEQPKSE